MKKILLGIIASVVLVVGVSVAPPASANTYIIYHAQPGSWYDAVKGGCWIKIQFGTFYVPYAKFSIINSSYSDPCTTETGIQVVAANPPAPPNTYISYPCTLGSIPDTYPNNQGCQTLQGVGYNGSTAWQYTHSSGTAIGAYVTVCSRSQHCDLILFSAF